MPERDETLSGCLPGGRKPTIIGGGESGMKKPTVISGSVPTAPSPSVTSIKPTAIATTLPTEKAAQQLKPLVITSTTPTPVSEPAAEKVKLQPTAISQQNEAPAKPIVLEKPSVMAGVVRKGIEVNRNSLSMHFPGTPDAILDRAVETLNATVIEILDERKCLQWGMEEQEKYGELVEETLRLSTNKVLQDSSRHIGRLQTLLCEIAQVFQDQGSSGLAFWKKRETPWEKFEENGPEISQISKLLRQALSEVVEVQLKLDNTADEFQSLLMRLDAIAISARYVSDMLSGKTEKQQALSQRLLDRALSLQQTVAHIQQGAITRQSTNKEIGKLVSKIQDVVLVQLPAWMEQLSNSQSKKLTDTDMYTFREGLNTVLQQLG